MTARAEGDASFPDLKPPKFRLGDQEAAVGVRRARGVQAATEEESEAEHINVACILEAERETSTGPFLPPVINARVPLPAADSRQRN